MPSLKKHLRQTTGAILIEVMVSLLIFTIGVVAAFGVLVQTNLVNTISHNRIVALNLARESLEVFKNIRDTNWMIYSSNLRECWNFSPDLNEDGLIEATDTCTANSDNQNNHPFGVLKDPSTRARTFIVDFEPATSRWMLLPAAKYYDEVNETFELYNGDVPILNGEADDDDIDISNFGNRDVELFIDSEGRYTHLPDGNTASPFIRVVDICYIDNIDSASGESCDNAGLFPSGVTGKGLDNRIQLTARVYWKDRPQDTIYKSVILETVITDYLDRNNWED